MQKRKKKFFLERQNLSGTWKGTFFVKNILRVFAKIFVFAKMFAKYKQDNSKFERQNEKISWGWKNLNYYRGNLCENGNVWKIFAKMGVFGRFSRKQNFAKNYEISRK